VVETFDVSKFSLAALTISNIEGSRHQVAKIKDLKIRV